LYPRLIKHTATANNGSFTPVNKKYDVSEPIFTELTAAQRRFLKELIHRMSRKSDKRPLAADACNFITFFF
jgi:hypothetical protein